MAVRTASWAEITQPSGAPKARSSHSLTVIGRKAYVFGGEFEPRVPIDNDLHVFDLDSRTWSIAPAHGDIPKPRIGVTIGAVGHKLYVFAGRDKEHEELNEFFSYDTLTGEWKTLPYGENSPPHRSYHTLVADEQRQQLYVFGGCGKDGRLNDLWSFNVTTNQWRAFPSSPICIPRGGPGLAVAGQDVWVVFGFNGKELGDVHKFNLKTETWEEVPLSGSVKPSPRSVFMAATLKDHIVLFGGEVDPSDLGHMGAGLYSDEVWALNPLTKEWIKLEIPPGPKPEARGWYYSSPVGTDQLLVYGGNSESNDRLDDMWLLTIH